MEVICMSSVDITFSMSDKSKRIWSSLAASSSYTTRLYEQGSKIQISNLFFSDITVCKSSQKDLLYNIARARVIEDNLVSPEDIDKLDLFELVMALFHRHESDPECLYSFTDREETFRRLAQVNQCIGMNDNRGIYHRAPDLLINDIARLLTMFDKIYSDVVAVDMETDHRSWSVPFPGRDGAVDILTRCHDTVEAIEMTWPVLTPKRRRVSHI